MKRLPILVLLLSGCATTQYHKPGVTEADLIRDVYECERDTRQFERTWEDLWTTQNRWFRLCMKARSYIVSPDVSP